MNIKKHKKGFSLVELLVVITIIAVLSVTAFVALGGQTGNARNARRQQDLSTLQSALEAFYIQNNNIYPAALTDLIPAYMVKLPVDPTSPTEDPALATTENYDYYTPPPPAARKTYVLGATLERGDTYEAYVVTNTDDAGIGAAYATGGVLADGTACDILLAGTNKATCFPYSLTD